jgi:hypothetical protein
VSDTLQTQIATMASSLDLITGDRLHCLEYRDANGVDFRHVVGPLGLKIGRKPPADVVLSDGMISRAHCLVALKDDEIYVSDLGSTNGTFVDGERITAVTLLPVGATLRVGNVHLKHEWRTRNEIEQSQEADRELQRASAYVQSLLPAPLREGPIRTDWVYEPSARLGGDAFGYGRLSDNLRVGYVIDVAGHGTGAAMLGVAVMNQLRQRSLPDTDMSQPGQVLGTLNRLFQMEEHAGLYFTIWYGVYDIHTRQLDYASAGHHPAYVVDAERTAATPIKTRNPVIGAMPGIAYKQDRVTLPPGASVYLFSDGVYEIVDRDGRQWGIEDFVELIMAPSSVAPAAAGEARRLYQAVRGRAHGPLEDDFSLVILTLE